MKSIKVSIPIDMLPDWARSQALTNHGQSLERLAERGGIDHMEAICILEGRRLEWDRRKWPEFTLKRLGQALVKAEERE